MRNLFLFIIIAIILNAISVLSHKTVSKIKTITKEGIATISFPVCKGLNFLEKEINNYVILIGIQQENNYLKEQLTKCKLECTDKTLHQTLSSTKSPLIKEAFFSFKGNFDSTILYLRVMGKLDLKRNYCFALSENMHLIGMIKSRIKKDIYKTYTVFNPSFVADVMVVGKDNQIFKALYRGNEYSPKVEFLDPNVNIKKGDKVYTSGDMGVFPPNLYIGDIRSVQNVNGYYKVGIVDINRSFFNKWKLLIVCKRK